MGRIVTLAPSPGSDDTIAALEALLTEAKAKKLIGIAYVGIYPAREYVIDVAGEAKRAPVFTHGLVGMLAYELVRIHRGRT